MRPIVLLYYIVGKKINRVALKVESIWDLFFNIATGQADCQYRSGFVKLDMTMTLL